MQTTVRHSRLAGDDTVFGTGEGRGAEKECCKPGLRKEPGPTAGGNGLETAKDISVTGEDVLENVVGTGV
jgi:hypothetical protein